MAKLAPVLIYYKNVERSTKHWYVHQWSDKFILVWDHLANQESCDAESMPLDSSFTPSLQQKATQISLS